MRTMASQTTSVSIVYSTVQAQIKENIKAPCQAGLCEGNSPATGEFPAQRASYAENVSIWWRHHRIHVNDPSSQNKCHSAHYYHIPWSCFTCLGIGSTVVSYLFRPQRDIWRNFRHWWHRKLWRRRPPVQPCSDKKIQNDGISLLFPDFSEMRYGFWKH